MQKPRATFRKCISNCARLAFGMQFVDVCSHMEFNIRSSFASFALNESRLATRLPTPAISA
jgi:hypothetical protein